MGSSSYYSSDEETSVRYRRESAPRSNVQYIQTRDTRTRPVAYYNAGPSLRPDNQLVTTTRVRSRSRERRSSPPQVLMAPQQMPPVVINNTTYNEHSSDDSDDDRRPRGGKRTSSYHHSHHSRHRSSSRDSHSRSRHGSQAMTREEYELEMRLERTRREVEALRMQRDQQGVSAQESYELRRARQDYEELRAEQERDRDRAAADKSSRETQALRQAKRELDEIKRREELAAEEKRIKKEMELKRLEEERREQEEKERREKEAKIAVEKYKMEESERREKEKREKELAEKEYQRRMQEDLIKSGVDEKDIQAIMEKKKIKHDKEKDRDSSGRPTYTRMARRHLSIETLRVYHIDYELDTDPNYILIKRWVAEDEQDMLWIHTKKIRKEREAKLMLTIDDHHHRSKKDKGDDFEWVRKKERKRSKSPGLLMYLAGAK